MIKERLAALESALTNQLPEIKTILRDIHTMIREDSDQVTLLTDEEIAIIVRGLKKQTATEIVTSAPKRKTATKLTLADL